MLRPSSLETQRENRTGTRRRRSVRLSVCVFDERGFVLFLTGTPAHHVDRSSQLQSVVARNVLLRGIARCATRLPWRRSRFVTHRNDYRDSTGRGTAARGTTATGSRQGRVRGSVPPDLAGVGSVGAGTGSHRGAHHATGRHGIGGGRRLLEASRTRRVENVGRAVHDGPRRSGHRQAPWVLDSTAVRQTRRSLALRASFVLQVRCRLEKPRSSDRSSRGTGW